MADVFTSRKRSAIMSQVRSRGNKRTELAMRKILRRHKFTGWRRHQSIFGNPDFVFARNRVTIFVDGCFWHCCPKHETQPASNGVFWSQKLDRNRARDRLVNRTLRKAGWRVFRVWQHELTRKNEARLVARMRKWLVGSDRV